MKAENWSNVVGGYISWIMDGYDLGAVVITSTILGKLFYPGIGSTCFASNMARRWLEEPKELLDWGQLEGLHHLLPYT